MNSQTNRSVGGLISNSNAKNMSKSVCMSNMATSLVKSISDKSDYSNSDSNNSWSSRMNRDAVRSRKETSNLTQSIIDANDDLKKCVDIQMDTYDSINQTFDVDYLYDQYKNSEYYANNDIYGFLTSDSMTEYICNTDYFDKSSNFMIDDQLQSANIDDMMKCCLLDVGIADYGNYTSAEYAAEYGNNAVDSIENGYTGTTDGLYSREGVANDGKATACEARDASIFAEMRSIERQFNIKDLEESGKYPEKIDELKVLDEKMYYTDMSNIKDSRLVDLKECWINGNYGACSEKYGQVYANSLRDKTYDDRYFNLSSEKDSSQSSDDTFITMTDKTYEFSEDIFENIATINKKNKEDSSKFMSGVKSVVSAVVNRYESLDNFVNEIKSNGLSSQQKSSTTLNI